MCVVWSNLMDSTDNISKKSSNCHPALTQILLNSDIEYRNLQWNKQNQTLAETLVFRVRSRLRRSFQGHLKPGRHSTFFIDLARCVNSHYMFCQNLQLLCSYCMDQLICQDVAVELLKVSTEPPVLFLHRLFQYSLFKQVGCILNNVEKREEGSITAILL